MDEEIFLLTATSDIPKILLLPSTFALKRSRHLFSPWKNDHGSRDQFWGNEKENPTYKRKFTTKILKKNLKRTYFFLWTDTILKDTFYSAEFIYFWNIEPIWLAQQPQSDISEIDMRRPSFLVFPILKNPKTDIIFLPPPHFKKQNF